MTGIQRLDELPHHLRIGIDGEPVHQRHAGAHIVQSERTAANRHQHHLVHALRVLGHHAHGDLAAHRMADHADTVDLERVEHMQEMLGDNADIIVARGNTAEAETRRVGSNHIICLGQFHHDMTPHGRTRAHAAAVDQQNWGCAFRSGGADECIEAVDIDMR